MAASCESNFLSEATGMGNSCGSGLFDPSELLCDPKLQVTVTTVLSPAARQLLTFPN